MYVINEETEKVYVPGYRSTSGVHGVYRQRQYWVAQIKINGRKWSLGCFKNKEDAVAARKKAETSRRIKVNGPGRRYPQKWTTEEERVIYEKEHCIAGLLRSAKSRNKNLDSDLSPSDLVLPDFCPILGIPLCYGRKGAKSFAPNSASLDRLEPAKGYTKGNVRIISMKANTLKRDCTDPSVFRKIADYIEQNSEAS